jgi:hypothetical protein
MYLLRHQMPLPRADFNGKFPSGDIAPRFHRFAHANRQSITGLQALREHNRKRGEILLFETTTAGEIKVLAEPGRPAAGPQACAAEKGQKSE